MRFSSALFSVSYCVAYVLVLLFDASLFLYYPEVGRFRWHWEPLTNSGPAMAWYGLMTVSALVATVVTLLLPEHLVPKPTQRHFWLVPPVALAGCVFLMRALLLA